MGASAPWPETRICSSSGAGAASIYFWRSHDGLEVDLLVRLKSKLYAVEIKLTATPTRRHTEGLDRFKALAKNEAAETGLLICRVSKAKDLPGRNVALPWQEFPAWIEKRL